MKNMFIVLMFLLAGKNGAGQTLTIIDQDYDLARRTAAQQQKMLIVDFYTTWCLPCKELDKTIFRNDSIAGEISKNFVVLRYDAEKDSVFNLSLKHHICSYPTTVVLTAGGRLVHKMFGMGVKGSLVENYGNLLRESIALNKQGKYIDGFSTTISPDLYPAFYIKYVRRTADIKPGDLDHYWAGNKDLESEVSLAVLAYFGDAPERVNRYFLEHKTRYENRFGKADVQFILDRMIGGRFIAAIKAKDDTLYTVAERFARQYLSPAQVEEYVVVFGLELDMAKGAWRKAAGLVDEQLRRKSISEGRLNYFCWKVYEQCGEKEVVAHAAQLMKDVVDSHPSFATLDTYARLLFKQGDKTGAKTIMQQAIAMGKAGGEDTRESEEALAQY